MNNQNVVQTLTETSETGRPLELVTHMRCNMVGAITLLDPFQRRAGRIPLHMVGAVLAHATR